jgi:hypothetical protein
MTVAPGCACSASAMSRLLVNTTMSLRSVGSASAMASVVVPASRMMVSPSRTMRAARAPMRFFSAAKLWPGRSRGRSKRAGCTAIAPPRMRRSSIRRSSASRSVRIVTAETPSASESFATSTTRSRPSNSRMRWWRGSSAGAATVSAVVMKSNIGLRFRSD